MKNLFQNVGNGQLIKLSYDCCLSKREVLEQQDIFSIVSISEVVGPEVH